MVDISRKTYGKNGIETIADNDGILWLNEKHIEKGLDHKNWWETAIKYHYYHRKHKYALATEPKKRSGRIFIDWKLAIKVIMDCRTTSAHKLRTKLWFKQYDVILRTEQPVLTKMISSFEGKNMQTEYNILSYRIDLYFHDYKLAKKSMKKSSDWNIEYN